MKNQSVFKSIEGKDKILNHYRSNLERLDYEFRERYVETSFGKTFLFEAGKSGNPIVFMIHGSCTNSAMWFGDIAVLSKHFHVFAVDIIGEAGNSDENRLDLNGDGYADWLSEVFEAAGITQAAVIGNSLGGWMSLKFACKYPEKVSKMILIATSGISPVRLSFVFKSILYVLMGRKGIGPMNKMIYGTDDIPVEAFEAGVMILENFKPMVGSLPIFTDDELMNLLMPVMYLAGEHDVTVDVEKTVMRLDKWIPMSSSHIIQDNGHVVYNVTDHMLAFLTR